VAFYFMPRAGHHDLGQVALAWHHIHTYIKCNFKSMHCWAISGFKANILVSIAHALESIISGGCPAKIQKIDHSSS
jgi:hypothetical protein